MVLGVGICHAGDTEMENEDIVQDNRRYTEYKITEIRWAPGIGGAWLSDGTKLFG